MPRPAWATFTALDLARGRRGLITPRSGVPRGRALRIQLELSNRGLEDGSAHGLPLAVLAPPVGEVHLDPLDAGMLRTSRSRLSRASWVISGSPAVRRRSPYKRMTL